MWQIVGKRWCFNLSVQASKKKCRELIIGSKVGCCAHLVFCPGFLNIARIVRQRKTRSFNDMRQLKYQSHRQSLRHVQRQKPSRNCHHVTFKTNSGSTMKRK